MSDHKFALITGATSGIGLELAKVFAKNDYNLVIVARNQADLERTAAQLLEQYAVLVVPISKDLSRVESPFEVYEEVKRQGIIIDVLVNDAGQGQYGEFILTDINREIEIINLNIVAYVALTKFFLRDMVQRRSGKILNVSSIGGEMPGPLQSVYHATKAFVTSFTEAVRNEVLHKGVTITALLPGVTDTDFFRKADQEDAKMVKEGDKADPAKVAQDGYDALMAGDHKIVSGLMNKAMVASSHVMPDDMVARQMHKMMEPTNDPLRPQQ
ncbi:MAG: SDR family NAD(P)-dependent oxidoreductase [Arcticibacter sp.]